MGFDISLVAVAKTAALTSSGVFAGYTWALSNAAVPAILKASTEAQLADQWRVQFLRGYIVSIPSTVTNALCFGYLAYIAPESSTLRTLYITAAVATSSGIPIAWTFLRHVNGALSIRCDKVAKADRKSIALRYSKAEKRSIATEKKYSTQDLVLMWKRYNDWRSAGLILGTFVGAWAAIQ